MSRHKKGRFHRNSRPGNARKNFPDQNKISHAYQLLQMRKFSAAERICRNILKTEPQNAGANHCLGVALQQLKRPDKAIIFFEKALASDPGYVPVYGNLANSLAQLGRMDDVKQVVNRALSLKPDSAIANWNLGELSYQMAHYDKAIEFYQRALAINPDDFKSRFGLGLTFKHLGRLDEALACCEDVIRLQPDDAHVSLIRGNILSDMGRMDDAAESYRRTIQLKADHAIAYQRLTGVRKHIKIDADLEAMMALYGSPNMSSENRAHLAFGLGKAFEDLQQYDKAIEFFKQANKYKRGLVTYSLSKDIELFSELKRTFDASFMEQHQGLGKDDNQIIFILGMPRSGTTLVEQILGSHSLIYGAGEFAIMKAVCEGAVKQFPDKVANLEPGIWQRLGENYLERLRNHFDSTKPYVTDKMPQNFLFIGMIATMLPTAKIIHCRRNPMDTCLSLFKNEFAVTGPKWCYDINELGDYYRLYADLMDHWHRVLPNRIYDIDYENLVANSEQQIRKLLNFCEIPFEPACLTFHKTKRVVRTLSFAQVRKPIYSSSVQLWKRYEKHLRPLISKLDGN